MPLYKKGSLPKEYVTPKYSKAFGALATGRNIEVGVLYFGPGEGAVEHSHPHEQMMYVLQGQIQVEMDGATRVLGEGELSHMPPNVPHRVTAVNGEALVLSSKNVIGGQGHRI